MFNATTMDTTQAQWLNECYERAIAYVVERDGYFYPALLQKNVTELQETGEKFGTYAEARKFMNRSKTFKFCVVCLTEEALNTLIASRKVA